MSDKKRILILQCSVGEFIDEEVVTPQISLYELLSPDNAAVVELALFVLCLY